MRNISTKPVRDDRQSNGLGDRRALQSFEKLRLTNP
jgi:hypothetical protein